MYGTGGMVPVTLILTREGCGQLYVLGALSLGREYVLNRRMAGSQTRSGRIGEEMKILPLGPPADNAIPHQLISSSVKCMHRSQIGSSSVHRIL
jgi:hypothetical protein